MSQRALGASREAGNGETSWEQQRRRMYYRYVDEIVARVGAGAGSILDASAQASPYIEKFSAIPRKVSLDPRGPYGSGSVEAVQSDLLGFIPVEKFDVVLCLGALDRAAEPSKLMTRLFEIGAHVIVSVPCKRLPGSSGKRYGRVDFRKLDAWAGRKPNYRAVVSEIAGGNRSRSIVAYYDVANPAAKWTGRAPREPRAGRSEPASPFARTAPETAALPAAPPLPGTRRSAKTALAAEAHRKRLEIAGRPAFPDEELGRARLYRFGFLCHRSADAVSLSSIPDWKQMAVGPYLLHLHPETSVRLVRARECTAVFVGDVFTCSGDASIDDNTRAFLDEGAWDAFDRLSGRFALLVLSESGGRVLHDPFGARTVFYRASGPFCVGSHSALVADACGAGIDPAAREFRESPEYAMRGAKYLPGDLTMYTGVLGLPPNNYYDIAAGRTRRYWPRGPVAAISMDEFLAASDEYLARLAGFLRARYNPVLGLTGGGDSRALIAGLRHFGAPLRTVTWGGHWVKKYEIPDIRKMARHLGLEHAHIGAPPASARSNTLNQLESHNLGFCRLGTHLASWMDEGSRPGDIFIRGYGAEIMRGFYQHHTATLQGRSGSAMVPVYLSGRVQDPGPRFVEFTLSAFEGFAQRANFGADFYNLDPIDLFYWEQRMGMWGAVMLNEMDAGMYAFTGFNSRPLYAAAFGLKPSERLSRTLRYSLVAHYDPRLARMGRAAAAEKRMRRMYYQYAGEIVARAGANASSLLETGSRGFSYIEKFDWIGRRVSLDPKRPYKSDTVEGIRKDFLQYQPKGRFDVVLCLHGLERLPDPQRHMRKLLETGEHVVVSVPYRRPGGGHDSERTLGAWAGRKPDYSAVVSEVEGGPGARRIVAYYDVANPGSTGWVRGDAVEATGASGSASPSGRRAGETEAPAGSPSPPRKGRRKQDGGTATARDKFVVAAAGAAFADVALGRARLYRFGFLCHRSADAVSLASIPDWKQMAVGPYLLHLHPETSVRLVRARECTAVFVGDVFTCSGDASIDDNTRAFLDEGAWNAFDRLSGRFALLVLSEAGGRVLHDPFGARTVFYRASGPFCVGSHSALVADATGQSIDPATREYCKRPEYRQRRVTYLPGDITMYANVVALTPNNYYDIAASKTHRYWPRGPVPETSIDEFLGVADEYLARLAGFLRGRYNPVLGLTGGGDSPALIAGLRHFGAPLRSVTWGGRWVGRDEVPVIRQMASHLGVEHAWIDTDADRNSARARTLRKLEGRNIGFYRSGNRLAVHMDEAARPGDVFIRGYGAEIMRGFYANHTGNLQDPPGRGMVPLYLSNRAQDPDPGFTIPAFERFAERTNFGADLYNLEPTDLFYWEHRMGMWGAVMLNGMDAGMYSFTGFNSRPLYAAAFGMKPAERFTGTLMPAISARYDPQLARRPQAHNMRR